MGLFGYSCVGENNKIRCYENQDHMCDRQYKNYRVMAISDGAGSCGHSGTAAKIASEAAVNYWINNIEFIRKAREYAIAESTLTVVEYHLKAAAAKNRHSYKDYCCTLIMCMKNVKTGELITLHVGDGSIYEFKGDEVNRISGPENGASCYQTCFTNDNDAMEHCRVKKLRAANNIMLCSDGLDHLFKTGKISMNSFAASKLSADIFADVTLADDTTVFALTD